ncbi:MAG: TlpA disulfide reductase family protein, partial [Myxococcota bacterium]
MTAIMNLAVPSLGWAGPPPARLPPETPLSVHEGAIPVGKPAPSFRIRALDGAMVRLDELAYPGRQKRYAPKSPVFIDFFRTDCQPCVKALPQLIQLHQKHAASGLKVFMVALLEKERGEEKLQAFLAKNPVPFTVVKDISDHVAQKFMGPRVSLPATFLLDREGVVRGAKFSARGELEAYFGPALASVLAHHAQAAAAP